MEKKVVEYKIGDSLREIINSIVLKVVRDSRDIYITTGVQGRRLISEEVKEYLIKSGFVISEESVSKDSNIDYYTTPFMIKVNIITDSSFDDGIVESPNNVSFPSYNMVIKTEEGETIAELKCIGKRPIFKEDLLILIKESMLDKKLDVDSRVIRKYIMNCLKNLE